MELEASDFDITLDDDDDNVQLSSAQLMEMMEEIWINEKFAPEILPHKGDIVDCVLGQISYMEQNLQTLPSTDFRKGIHELEVSRIRFVMASYLRNRLEKIESYAFHIIKQEELRLERGEDTYLTQSELQFAKSYQDGVQQHFDVVTSFSPSLPLDDWKTQLPAPNMQSFVFLKAKSNVDGVAIEAGKEDSDVVDLVEGSQLIISYQSIADLLKKNDVSLI